MRTRVSPRLRPRVLVAAVLLSLPAILFYGILLRKAVNVPLLDDYEALLDFLNHLAELESPSARVSYFLAAQFNEYKLFFGHAVAWLQLAFLGHIDLRVLCAIGNGFVLLLAILLWTMFLPDHENLARRMAFFIPVSYLLFQLGYSATLNWAMPSLQNLSVLVFSLGTIYLLVRGSRQAFCVGMIGLILAVSASGNGFLVIPIGVIILALSRHYVRLVSWLIVSAGSVAAYAYHYDLMSSQSRLHHSVLETVLHLRPLYVIAFMGSVAAFPPLLGRYHLEVLWSTSLGLLLCAYFFVLARRGYPRRNPAVCLLHFVSITDSDWGRRHSLRFRHIPELGVTLRNIFRSFSHFRLVLNRRGNSSTSKSAPSTKWSLFGRSARYYGVLSRDGLPGVALLRRAQSRTRYWDGCVRASCLYQVRPRARSSHPRSERKNERT